MNLIKYYLYSFFKELIPMYPLYSLMFASNGLTVVQISMLFSIWSIPAIILEIPTGILSDRWSRKKMMFLGKLLKAVCFIFWLFSDGFWLYAVGFLFWGIGGAFVSGSEEALLYDSLTLMGREDRFDQILGKCHFLSGISTIIASVIGGWIGMYYGYQAALILSVITALLTGGIVITMKEVNLYKERLDRKETCEKENTLLEAIAFLYQNKKVMLIAFLSLFVILTAGILDEYDQLIAKSYGLSISMIGIWTAIRFLLISFGGYTARGFKNMVEKIFHKKDSMFVISFLCMVAGLFLVVSGLTKHFAIMALYGLYYLVMSSCEVLQEDYVQQSIENEGRSTVHSVISLLQNVCGIGFFSSFGLVVASTNMHVGLMVSGIYIVIITITIGIIYTKLHRSKLSKSIWIRN